MAQFATSAVPAPIRPATKMQPPSATSELTVLATAAVAPPLAPSLRTAIAHSPPAPYTHLLSAAAPGPTPPLLPSPAPSVTSIDLKKQVAIKKRQLECDMIEIESKKRALDDLKREIAGDELKVERKTLEEKIKTETAFLNRLQKVVASPPVEYPYLTVEQQNSVFDRQQSIAADCIIPLQKTIDELKKKLAELLIAQATYIVNRGN